MRHFNILIFPGGSEIGLEIQKALSGCKEITLFSAGMDLPNHASYVFRKHFIVPSIREKNWLEELNKIIRENAIDYIFPAYDDVIVALAQHSELIRARLILPPKRTCEITRSKSSTYKHFKGIVPVPTIYYPPFDSLQFPVFFKPDKGQASENAFIVQNKKELDFAISKDKTALILEYLPGKEVTIDCFSDRESGVLFCGGRLRVRTKAGISMSSKPIIDPNFMEIALAIYNHLEIYGAWFFQLKKDKYENYKLLEIAPRIAGTMALHRVMGINFALLSIYEHERIPISILTNPGHIEIERALINRYCHRYEYSVVYIDLDDTIILNGQVNIDTIRFVYQCINRGIKVKLITKHSGNLLDTLKRFRLEGIFDEVIHLNNDQKKADYIIDKGAILIDDSFSERFNVHYEKGIRTFDSSMIEALIDERK